MSLLNVFFKVPHTNRRRILSFFVALVFSLSLLLFMLMRPAHAQTDTFTSSGSWIVPSYVSSAIFEAWGGGGGAGGGATNNSSSGGGGAGGQYAKTTLSGLNSGDSYTVTVAGTTSGGTGNGSAGGSSSVTSPSSTTVVLAQGGGGGTANNGAGGTGSTSGGVGDVVYAGGNGATGSSSGGGGGGGGAGSGGSGGNASGTTGGGGTSANGGNGGNGPTSRSGGATGSSYGGAGSGAHKTNGPSQSGGTGAAGYVTITYTVNSAPAAPTLITPASGATGVSLSPHFTLRTTDADSDYLQYRIYLYQSDCSTAVGASPFAQASSQTGWSGQDADSGLAYTGSSTLSGSTIATYTYQGSLSYSTTYCWKADAVDPGGTNTYSASSATQTFTTMSPPSTDQFLRGGEYFSGGSKQPFYWAK